MLLQANVACLQPLSGERGLAPGIVLPPTARAEMATECDTSQPAWPKTSAATTKGIEGNEGRRTV